MPVFLSLASAAGWFEGAGLLDALALRLKTMLLFEKDIVVDPSAFLVRISAGDVSEQFFAGASAPPWSRSDVNIVRITRSDGVVEMRMDWAPLLAGAGVVSVEGVRFASQRLPPQTKRALKPHIERVSQDGNVVDTLPDQPRIRETIVKHWLLDAAAAHLEGAAMAADLRALAFLNACETAVDQRVAAPWEFRLHDVRRWPWEGVLRFRSSRNGELLRELLASQRAGGATPELQETVDKLVGRDPSLGEIQVVWRHSLVPSALLDAVSSGSGTWVTGPAM